MIRNSGTENTSACHLCLIGSNLFLSTVLVFLDWPDIAKFDHSLTNHHLRLEYRNSSTLGCNAGFDYSAHLSAGRLFSEIIVGFLTIESDRQAIWLLKHNVKCKSLLLHAGVTEALVNLLANIIFTSSTDGVLYFSYYEANFNLLPAFHESVQSLSLVKAGENVLLSYPSEVVLSLALCKHVSKFTSLLKLDMCGCDLDDECVGVLVTGCVLLTSLSLSYNCNITGEAMRIVGQNCPNLLALDVENCTSITNGLEYVGQGCKNLRHFSTREMKSSIEAMRGCTQLRSLILFEPKGWADSQSMAIGDTVACLTLLNELTLTCTQVKMDDILEIIGSNCAQLHVLDLTRTTVTGRGLVHIMHPNNLITRLFLNGCKLTNECIRTMTERAAHLTEFALPASVISGDALQLVATWTGLEILHYSLQGTLHEQDVKLFAAARPNVKLIRSYYY